MLDNRYDVKKVQEGKYAFWKKQGYFQAGDLSKCKFSMVIPPPNVTGKLHLGHAWNTTVQDIIARYKRAKGYDVLWLPGMDHAGIATQAKVEERMRKQGISRYDLGREGFLKKAWEWKHEFAESIHQQWEMMGLALDYSRERFTLDEGLNQAVREVFVHLYEKGFLYRGERIINWDPVFKTALSNIEVIHQEEEGKFYFFTYSIEGEVAQLTIATTRPETMFGDVCVVVHPEDERYQAYIGKRAMNPANHQWIPIIGDRYVDPAFGTGAMKCTPAHDPNDFVIGQRYHFDSPIIFHDDATMNANCGKYEGMDRYQCRDQLVKDIQEEGHFVKIETIQHAVGYSERSHVVVEPMLKKQWFVKMEPLAKAALENQQGIGAVEFLPERFEKIFTNWMENCEDWCISRQLWWGHRIPAYYHKQTGEVVVSKEPLNEAEYTQDEDVLDTWFSSALWTFSTLGWPEETEDLKRYFPLDILVTAYDIIFFWVSRMIFQGLEFQSRAPFKKCLIHGLIRDAEGKKMSKSAGNGIDPLDVIETYGIDALRYFLTTSTSPGLDARYSDEKLQATTAFLNKIWNATRFSLSHIEGKTLLPITPTTVLDEIDTYILSRLQTCIENVTHNMEKYDFANASTHLYNFVYDDFTSWYLELAKVKLQAEEEETKKITRSVLYTVLRAIILMIYPYTPFIAEEIYLQFPDHRASIMEERYPEVEKAFLQEAAVEKVQILIAMIKEVRSFKVAQDLAPNAPIQLTLHEKTDGAFASFLPYLRKFTFATSIEISSQPLSDARVYALGEMSIHSHQDQTAALEKIEKELNFLQKEIDRCKGMLKNPAFLAKAPQEKVALEEKKLSDLQEKWAAYQQKKQKVVEANR